MDYDELAKQMSSNLARIWKYEPQRQMNESFVGEKKMLGYLLMKRDSTVNPREISRVMNISSARTAAALKNLEKKGIIERQIDPADRRQIIVTLTPTGVTAAEASFAEHLVQMKEILQALGAKDGAHFVRILRK